MIHEIKGKKIEVRGLTRGELRRLKDNGIELEEIKMTDKWSAQEPAVCSVIEIAAPGVRPDDCTPGELFNIVVMIAQLTFIGEAAVKKLYESPDSTIPGGSKTAETVKKKASRRQDAARN